MAIKDIIGPGFKNGAKFIVTRGFGASLKGFLFESMQMTLTLGGRRRYNVADSPTASTNKGWSFESLQAMITQGGARRK